LDDVDGHSKALHRTRSLIGGAIDVLPAVLQMLIAERFKFIVMGGDRLRHCRAPLHRFRIEMKLTDDDMPAEDPETRGPAPPRGSAAAIRARPRPSPVMPASPGAWPAAPGGVPTAKICRSGRARGPGAVPAGVACAVRFRAKN
jgi:hypothetical protein